MARIPSFIARPLGEVHATIIGLDSYGALSPEEESTRLPSRSGEGSLHALCQYFGDCLDSGSTVQFGGFVDRDYDISSRGERLFKRTITLNRGQLMLLGWPVPVRGDPMNSLDELRRGAQRFGVTHRYHKSEADKDPDLYMVIGAVGALSAQDNIEVEGLRRSLATTPSRIPLSTDSVSVAVYSDTRLPASSTRTWPLREFMARRVNESNVT